MRWLPIASSDTLVVLRLVTATTTSRGLVHIFVESLMILVVGCWILWFLAFVSPVAFITAIPALAPQSNSTLLCWF